MKLPVANAPQVLPSRRELLQLMGVGAAWLLFPGCSSKKPTQPGQQQPYVPKFLTAAEAAALGALADAILPPDQDPGGRDLGTVEYVDRLLTAFEGGGPVYAGGPYSGRQPLPNPDGTPSKNFPQDGFANALPLDRVLEHSWRLHLYGSDAVGGGPNDAITGKVVGLRDQVRNGLQKVMALSSTPLDQLDLDHLTALLNDDGFDPDFRNLLVELVAEASFSPPEYGGNKDGAGWKMVFYEGDSQPLGYSWFNTTTGMYAEDPNHPVSTPNPQADPYPFDDDTRQTLNTIVAFLGGKTFS